MSQELDFSDQLMNEGFTPFGEIDELEKEDLLYNEEIFQYLFSIQNSIVREKTSIKLQMRAKELKISRQFNNLLKTYKEEMQKEYVYEGNVLSFKGLKNGTYNADRYELSENGKIVEVIPNLGKILVCYHPIVPVEKYKNVEDGTEKIKLGYCINGDWNYIIVNKSEIASPQAIIKLSDVGVAVTSENAKFLIKYLAEMENLNRETIDTNISISRLGWLNDKLIPYNRDYEFDNEKDFPRVYERFGESGTLEEWADFFRERRKYNDISRIIMGGAVVSIFLKHIKQSGFTIHVWGESEYGKTVACMVGQSIFGNPSQTDMNGIGINFNFTNAGLEYRLNLYNNIPLFVNEMQLQKEAKDYDKMLFMIESGRGKSRATKVGGIGKETTWNNVVITNGEKNIVKMSSDNGAYNRCLSCEVSKHSFEDLSEVADFSKENYGTAIREILKNINEYDFKEIYKEKLEEVKKADQGITEKQKIIEALIMTGDKILTDIVFKDKFYLKPKNFDDKVVKKSDLAIEKRAFELIKDWFISERRCFLGKDSDDDIVYLKNNNIYGKEMDRENEGYVAFLIGPLREYLKSKDYDFEQIIKLWSKKGYSKCDVGKNQKNVRINGELTKCIMVNMRMFEEKEEETEYFEEMPF